tara:strand:- start:537 stop:1814 length:1278 start_codon:yes stop_codon:yes gene_type:complete
MHICYKLIAFLLYPLIVIYLYFRKLKKKEHPERYKEKLSKIKIQRGEGFLIWFHVASVGEAMSILPLIDDCVKEKKINKILITSITLSSGKILSKRFGESEKLIHQYLPFDISFLTKKFLNHWKPNLCIFIDSEIWPNLILQISEEKIPLLLINARITEKSFKRWKLLNNFARKIFNKFDLCISSNKETEFFLKSLGAENIKNYGNLKFSNTQGSSNKKLNSEILNKIENRKIWCAASTHPGEENFCAKVHIKIKKNFNNILTIIIPRHIDRTNKIASELRNLNLNVVLYSKWNELSKDTDILIIDSYGESLKFYDISKCVFVGKSISKNIIKDSGQNPIEPARLGCKIFHGPNINNFIEIYDFLKNLGISKKIDSDEKLSLFLVEELTKDKIKNKEIITKIENYGQNIFNNVIIELKKYINNSR